MANQFPLVFSKQAENIKASNDSVSVTPIVCRALVVDDNPLKLMVCCMAMEKWCQQNVDMNRDQITYQIEKAVDAKEAMEKIRNSIATKQLFDVILMDHLLPDIESGIKLTNDIIALLANHNKPVVIGCSDNYAKATGLDLSCYSGVVSYPFKWPELFKLLETHLTPPLKTRRLINK